MTCKKCRHEFCWVCMGLWSTHDSGYFNCSRYDESKVNNEQQSKSRASLERYLFVSIKNWPNILSMKRKMPLICNYYYYLVLQQICKSRTVCQAREGCLFANREENGRNPSIFQSILDWSAIYETSCRYAFCMPCYS